jgi:hypothetical protein
MAVDVTVTDVRVALNNISIIEVADETIQQKIDDIAEWLTEHGYNIDVRAARRYIRSWAALRSFAISRTYSMMKQGDLQVKREWQVVLDELKNDSNDSWAELIGAENFTSVSTAMFDNRPEDPLDTGTEED